MSGFITIERDLFSHEFFDNEPMSEREAWVWMLANARWKDGRHKVGKDMHDVPRGTFMATLREMQSRFMWGSDTKVRNFLKRLEKEGMIERTTVGSRNAPKTHVSICNYSEYQASERTENVPKTHHERTKNAVKKQGNKGTREDTNVSSSKAADDFYLKYFDAHPNGVEGPRGEAAFTALVGGGVDPRQIIASAGEYAAHVKGWSKEAKVQQSDNFLDADRGKWREFIPKPKAVPATQEQIMAIHAQTVIGRKSYAASTISVTMANRLLAADLVTPDQLKAAGVAQ